MKNNEIFSKIAEALMIDYSSVYYVNALTNEYYWYSADPEFRSLQIEQSGKDFFLNMKRDAAQVVYEEDRHIFTEDIQKENLLAAMKSGNMKSLEYRLMIDGRPVYHTIRIIRGASSESEDDYFILGVINVDKEVRMRQEAEKAREERRVYNQIAESLAGNYDNILYIDIDDGKYFEFSSTEKYRNLNASSKGENFFAEVKNDIRRLAYPDDVNFALSMYERDNLLSDLEGRSSFSFRYRIMVNGAPRHYSFTVFRANDEKHLVLCLRDVEDEITAEKAQRAKHKINVTYGQIAESLASNYDVIYYVSIMDGSYVGYTTNAIYGQLEVQEEGKDFFTESRRNSEILVHPQDKERVKTALGRDNLISTLENRKQYSIDYRLVVDGKPQYTRFTVKWSSDRKHFIIGVENIDAEVKNEKEHLQALNTEKELARRDGLTGVKNKTAYTELERSVQRNIDDGMDYLSFALVVCDINGLKEINDTEGHKAGDEYIRAGARLICEVFSHSPVFRIGGDEFVVFLRGSDYPVKEKLFEKFRNQVLENTAVHGRPVIASGIADYDPAADRTVAGVFERADNMMYENKRILKGE